MLQQGDGEVTQAGDDKVSAPPTRDQRRWRRIGTAGVVLACLLGVAVYVVARPGRTSSGRTGAGVSGRIAPTDRGDDGRRPTRRCPCLRHRAGIRAPAEHRHRQEPRRRPADGGAFPGGADSCSGGDLLAEIDPRPFQVAADPGRGPAGAATRRCSTTRASTSSATSVLCRRRTRSPSSSSTRRTSLVRQLEGTVKTDQGADRQRQAAAHLLPHHRADQRARRPAPGRPRQHRPRDRHQRPRRDHAAPADRRALHDPGGQPARGARQAAAPASSLPVEAYDREQQQQARRPGSLLTVDNQIDPTTGTVKLKARLRERRQRAVPEPVRQRAPARRHPARRRPWCPTAADPARRRRARSSTW